MNEIQPTPLDIEALKAFPFIDDVTSLKAELPSYLSASEDVSASIDICKWWQNHQDDLPAWATVCKLVLLVQPSSAAAERVFSLLQNYFTDRQKSSLED